MKEWYCESLYAPKGYATLAQIMVKADPKEQFTMLIIEMRNGVFERGRGENDEKLYGYFDGNALQKHSNEFNSQYFHQADNAYAPYRLVKKAVFTAEAMRQVIEKFIRDPSDDELQEWLYS